MRNSTIPILAVLFLLASCSAPRRKPDAPLADLLESYHEGRSRLYPIDATYAGDARFNHLLPNPISEEHRKSLREFYGRYLDQIQRYDRIGMSSEEQISCDTLRWECEVHLQGLEFPTHLTPINQFESLYLTIGQFASGRSAQPFKTVEDYDNWIERLHGFIA